MLWLLAIPIGAMIAGAFSGKGGDATRGMTEAELRRLNKLQPNVRTLLLLLKTKLRTRGIEFFLGDTLRTAAEQRSLVAQGRSLHRLCVRNGLLRRRGELGVCEHP